MEPLYEAIKKARAPAGSLSVPLNDGTQGTDKEWEKRLVAQGGIAGLVNSCRTGLGA